MPDAQGKVAEMAPVVENTANCIADAYALKHMHYRSVRHCHNMAMADRLVSLGCHWVVAWCWWQLEGRSSMCDALLPFVGVQSMLRWQLLAGHPIHNAW